VPIFRGRRQKPSGREPEFHFKNKERVELMTNLAELIRPEINYDLGRLNEEELRVFGPLVKDAVAKKQFTPNTQELFTILMRKVTGET